MKKIHSIKFSNNNVTHLINFGFAETEIELESIYKLRYKIYVNKKNYIPKGYYKDDKDVDFYDKKNSSVNIIAEHNGEIVGSLRIIKSRPLPIRDHYFNFKTPKSFDGIDESRIVEIGRLISIGKINNSCYIPRHLTMLGMFYVISYYFKENNIIGLYGALKLYIFKKIKKINLPVKLIKNYQSIFEIKISEDPLKNFFNNPNDPVVPVYLNAEDGYRYLDSLFNSSLVFKKEDTGIRIYRNNFRFIMFVLRSTILKY